MLAASPLSLVYFRRNRDSKASDKIAKEKSEKTKRERQESSASNLPIELCSYIDDSVRHFVDCLSLAFPDHDYQ